jgi:ubiquinone/menaquinone biosynthesis C-methylase UbiE
MGHDYSQTYRTSKDVLDFHRYRMSPVHQAILDQEVWAILNVDERTGKEFFKSNLILELAIGGGAISNNLAEKLQNSNLVGVDVSRNMIKACKTNLSNSSQVGDFSLIVADVFHLPLQSSSLNSVITVRLIPNLLKNDLALKEVSRILKPDGQVIFDIYNRMSVMSLLDSVLNLSLRRRSKPYKHTCFLNQTVKTCESAGLEVKSHMKCLLLTEALFKFVPNKLLSIAMIIDRIVSNLPLFSKISTRVFILSRKRKG